MSGSSNNSAGERNVKSREAFRTISEVADSLDLPQHVLRFWESKFSQIRPMKRGGNRRYYRPEDVRLITAVKQLLHGDGYTIRGVQKLFKAQGVKATIAQALGEEARHKDAPELRDVSMPIAKADLKPEFRASSQTSLFEMDRKSESVKEPIVPAEMKTHQNTIEKPSTPEKKKELSSLLDELKSIRSELS